MVEKQDGSSLDPWHCLGSGSSGSCSRLSVRGKPTCRSHCDSGFVVVLLLQHHLAYSNLQPPWRHLTLPTSLGLCDSKLSRFPRYFNFIFSALKILFPSPSLKILEFFSFLAWVFFSSYSIQSSCIICHMTRNLNSISLAHSSFLNYSSLYTSTYLLDVSHAS